jgi:hypothetical protein
MRQGLPFVDRFDDDPKRTFNVCYWLSCDVTSNKAASCGGFEGVV